MRNWSEYDDIRQYVERNLGKYKQRQRVILFLVHLGIFVGLSALGFMLAISGRLFDNISDLLKSSSNPLPASFLILFFGWMTGIILHGVSLYLESKAGETQLRGQLALRAMGQKMMGSLETEESEKPKRSQAVQLSDDGELVPIEEEEPKSASRSKS